jgi:hypothetical protein
MNGNLSSKTKNIIRENLRLQCILIFVEAYKLSTNISPKEHDNDWDEDQFTAYLFQYMEDQPLTLENHWIISPQTPLYTKEVSVGKIHASKAKRPDIKFAKYHASFQKPFCYYIEAKNISENNWEKSCGSKVDASKQRARYIDTGIKHFKEGIYPDGCLSGYVVQGDVENSFCKLNSLLEKRECNAEILIKKQLIGEFDACYISTHIVGRDRSFQLKHIFLKF